MTRLGPKLSNNALESTKELAEEQKTRRAAQARISEIEEGLKSAFTESKALKASKKKDVTKLKKLAAEHQEAASLAKAAKEELQRCLLKTST